MGLSKLKFNAPLSPIILAIWLSIITFFLCLIFLESPVEGSFKVFWLFSCWERGIWSLLEFTMQMVLVVIFGHAIAVTPFFSKVIDGLLQFCTNFPLSVFFVSFFSILLGFVNWGLGLVFGAIFSKRAANHLKFKGIPFNYPILGAAGFTGMLIWHGGLSGSAPLKVADKNHFLVDLIGVIHVSETIFSTLNIVSFSLVLILIPLLLVLFSIFSKHKTINWSALNNVETNFNTSENSYSFWTYFLGFLLLSSIFLKFWTESGTFLSTVNLNTIIQVLFGFCLLLSKNMNSFLFNIKSGIENSIGIIIQFPLYGGIMGLFTYSGLLEVAASQFANLFDFDSLPFFTLVTAAIVNIFVPSGGGQWAVQGPLIVDAALKTGASMPKIIMAFAYGDQLTNMIQPFWAIPLLAITGLKPKDLIVYTFFIMLLASFIFVICLWIF